jgi:hypothetical protein
MGDRSHETPLSGLAVDNALRRGWTQIIQPEDIDDHMHQVGRAAANAALLETQDKSEQEKLLLVSGRTGQSLSLRRRRVFQAL